MHLIPAVYSTTVTRPTINAGLAISSNDLIFCGKPVALGTGLRGCVITVLSLRD